MSQPAIGVIGAGVTGISCAHQLKQHGLNPIVFEKSRGLGGRLATRRIDDAIQFDHGVQYVTARSAAFGSYLDGSVAAEDAGFWHPKPEDVAAKRASRWIVGKPGMNRLVKPMAEGIDVRLNSQIARLRRDASGWLIDAGPDASPAKVNIAILTCPAPQTIALLESEPALVQPLHQVSIAPCWALLATFDTDLALGFEHRRFETGAISWMARNDTKPGRQRHKPCWVVHASPAWSRQHLELEREQVQSLLIDELAHLLGKRLPDPAYATAHRWRYAMTETPLGRPFLASDDRTLFIGGDWCLGARVEYGFQSGRAIADTVIDALGRRQ